MKHHHVTLEEYEKAIQLHQQGLSSRAIAKVIGVSKTTILFWFSKEMKPYCAWSEKEKSIYKEKIRLTSTGRIHSDETKDKIRKSKLGSLNPHYGMHPSQETIEKWKKSREGYKHTPETINKIRLSKLDNNNPNWKGNFITDDSARRRARYLVNPPKGFEVHHKDGNTQNNDLSNLMIVTRKQHMELDGRMEKFIEAGIPNRPLAWKMKHKKPFTVTFLDKKTRICRCCKIELPFSEFHKDKSDSMGITRVCRICNAKRYKDKELKGITT